MTNCITKLKVTNLNETWVDLDEEEDINTQPKGVTLIGKVISDKKPFKSLVQNMMQRAWPFCKQLRVSNWSNDLFLFNLDNEITKQKIIRDSPWFVNRKVIIFGDIQEMKTIEEQVLNFALFWVHVYGLPYRKLTKTIGERIGNMIGKIIMVDTGGILKRNYLRIRVALDTNEALQPGFWLKRDEDSSSWVEFKYEKLMDFCYTCGFLGHDDRGCTGSRVIYASEDVYGSWIRGEHQSIVDTSKYPILSPLRKFIHRNVEGEATPELVAKSKMALMDGTDELESFVSKALFCHNQRAVYSVPTTRRVSVIEVTKRDFLEKETEGKNPKEDSENNVIINVNKVNKCQNNIMHNLISDPKLSEQKRFKRMKRGNGTGQVTIQMGPNAIISNGPGEGVINTIMLAEWAMSNLNLKRGWISTDDDGLPKRSRSGEKEIDMGNPDLMVIDFNKSMVNCTNSAGSSSNQMKKEKVKKKLSGRWSKVHDLNKDMVNGISIILKTAEEDLCVSPPSRQ